jgi:hypothetical protein
MHRHRVVARAISQFDEIPRHILKKSFTARHPEVCTIVWHFSHIGTNTEVTCERVLPAAHYFEVLLVITAISSLRDKDLKPCTTALCASLLDRKVGDRKDLSGKEKANTGVISISSPKDLIFLFNRNPNAVILTDDIKFFVLLYG